MPVNFDLPRSSYTEDDRLTVRNFKQLLNGLDDDPDAAKWRPIPGIDRAIEEQQLSPADIALSLEKGIFAGVETIESIWFIVGEFLFLLTKGGLWEYLDGSPATMREWAMMREIDMDSDNPLDTRSYPLFSKWRQVYRVWFYKIGRRHPAVLERVQRVTNIDVLESYARIVHEEHPEHAEAWAEDAEQEKDPRKSQRKARMAEALAEKRGVAVTTIMPADVNKIFTRLEKKHPHARVAGKVPVLYRGNIPIDAYVEEEVIAVSESETHITIRRVDEE